MYFSCIEKKILTIKMVTAFFIFLPVCFEHPILHPILQSLRITDMKVRLYAENMILSGKDEKNIEIHFLTTIW